MAKIATTIKLTDEMYVLVKATTEMLKEQHDPDIKQSNLFEGMAEFCLREKLAEFMKFYINGFEIKDGRYKNGTKQ